MVPLMAFALSCSTRERRQSATPFNMRWWARKIGRARKFCGFPRKGLLAKSWGVKMTCASGHLQVGFVCNDVCNMRYLKALLELRPTSWEKRKSVAGRVNLLEGVVFRPYKILPRDGGFLDHSVGRRDG